MPTYERTHPWISFRFDFSRASAQLWLLLGEAQSKCEHIAGVPLRPNVAKELKDVAQNLNFAAAQFFQKVF